jgi:hypothetical protein
MARHQAAIAALSLAVVALLSNAQETRPPADPLAPGAPGTAPASPKPEREGRRDDDGKGPDRKDWDRKDRDKDGDGKDDDRRKHRGVFTGPDAEKAREAFRNMSPEERERWTKRIREWAEMPPEKKKSLADREEFFKKKIKEDIEAAIQKTGLTLNEEQAKLFAERYLDERRKIESELRKEIDEKRGPRVDSMIEKLKGEFSATVDVTQGKNDKAEKVDKR